MTNAGRKSIEAVVPGDRVRSNQAHLYRVDSIRYRASWNDYVLVCEANVTFEVRAGRLVEVAP